jgi:hypothetical protein
MAEAVLIASVEQDGEDGVIFTFTDRTTAAYVVEELLELRPHRETLPSAPTVMDHLQAS